MEEEANEPMDFKKYIAELIGTFVLVLIGCGSAVFAMDHIGYLGVSFAFGLAVLAMVYAIGPISGCHINPAISIAMLFAGKQKPKDTAAYIISQVIGAIIAAGLLYIIATGFESYDLGITGLGQNGFGQETKEIFDPVTGLKIDEITSGYTMMAAFIAEVVLTFVFLMVIFGSTSKKAPKGFAGISIGLSLVFIHLVGIPITGTSVNPARSIGPAIFAGPEALTELWLFIVAPILGALLAALLWKNVFEEKVEEEEEEELPPRRRDHHTHREHHSRRPVGRYR